MRDFEFEDNSAEAMRLIRSAMLRGLNESAEKTVEIVKDELNSKVYSKAIDATGELRDSIKVEKQGYDFEIVATAPHAEFVEFGTSTMSPRPFMKRSSTRARKEAVLDLVPQAVKEALN